MDMPGLHEEYEKVGAYIMAVSDLGVPLNMALEVRIRLDWALEGNMEPFVFQNR